MLCIIHFNATISIARCVFVAAAAAAVAVAFEVLFSARNRIKPKKDRKMLYIRRVSIYICAFGEKVLQQHAEHENDLMCTKMR